MKKSTTKVLSLFSGSGGMDLGFKMAGFEIIFAIDNDPAACKTYRHNFKSNILCMDIVKAQDKIFPTADVVIGGFPCQGFSHANAKRNIQDPRNSLYKQFLRVLKIVKPKYFVAENVKGILSLDNGKIFDRILSDFQSCGYSCKYKVLCAADYGVPQLRQRVFIVGTRQDIVERSPEMPPTTTHSKNPTTAETEEWISVGKALQDLPEPSFDSKLPNHNCYSKFKLKFNGYLGNRYIDPNKPAPTVTARGDSRGGVVVLHHPSNLRRMTPRELATVQSYPLDFSFQGGQSEAYKQIGNSVPPLLAYAVAKCIKKVLKKI